MKRSKSGIVICNEKVYAADLTYSKGKETLSEMFYNIFTSKCPKLILLAALICFFVCSDHKDKVVQSFK